MKLIRHLSPSGPAFAALQADGSVREVVGDILGDYRVTDRVVVPGKRLAVTLSCDHRVVDGALGARFLQSLRDLVEHPLKILA